MQVPMLILVIALVLESCRIDHEHEPEEGS